MLSQARMLALPIDAVLPELGEAVRSARAVVLEAPPGAGKTTRVPWAMQGWLGDAEVLVAEPRRLAARMAARRVADEHGFSVTHHKLELYGLCAACQQRQSSPNKQR